MFGKLDDRRVSTVTLALLYDCRHGRRSVWKCGLVQTPQSAGEMTILKFCCHKTMFTRQALHNSGQNKCRQLLIAVKPLFVLDVLQRMIFDFCQCHVGCRRSNKQFIWKSAWVQCLSGPSCYKSGWVRTQKNTASSSLTVARCFINRAPVLSLGQRKSTASQAENTVARARTHAQTNEQTENIMPPAKA